MAKKRKVVSAVFNAEDAEYIEMIKDDLLRHTGKKYNDKGF